MQGFHYQTLGQSQFFSDYVNGHRKKESMPIPATRYQPFFNTVEAQRDNKIPARAANTVMGLISDRKMPGWIFEMLPPLDSIRGASDEHSGVGECWQNVFKFAVFCPKVEGDMLIAPLALIGPEVNGHIDLRVLGTGEPKYSIEVLNEAETPTARIGAQFLIKEVLADD